MGRSDDRYMHRSLEIPLRIPMALLNLVATAAKSTSISPEAFTKQVNLEVHQILENSTQMEVLRQYQADLEEKWVSDPEFQAQQTKILESLSDPQHNELLFTAIWDPSFRGRVRQIREQIGSTSLEWV